MKKIFRRLAGRIVAYYYGRLYGRAKALADRRHAEDGGMWYVVDHLVKGRTLAVIDRRGFRRMKMDAQRWRNPGYAMYYENTYNLQLVKDGGWYHTADRSGAGALDPKDEEVRRLAFIRLGLKRAKLTD